MGYCSFVVKSKTYGANGAFFSLWYNLFKRTGYKTMSLSRSIVQPIIKNIVTDIFICRYIPNFNGIDQRVDINSLSVSPGDELQIEFIAPDSMPMGVFKRFAGSEDFLFSIDTGSAGLSFRVVGASAFIDGSPIVSGVTPIPSDGKPHVLTWIVNISNTLESIYGLKNTTDRNLGLPALGFKAWSGGDRTTGTLVRNMPLDDGFSNNPTARNLAGADGSFVNMTNSDWIQRCGI